MVHLRDMVSSWGESPISLKTLKLIPLPLAMIGLGAALARYADSPLLILLFIGALTLVSFMALDYALYILVGFLPFSFRFIIISGTEMQIPTEPLLAAMAAALFLKWLVRGRREDRIRFPFWLPFLLYAFSLGLSTLNAGSPYSAVKGSVRAVAYMLLAVVVFNVIKDKRRLKWLFVTAVAPAAVAVGWTVIFLADRLDVWMWSKAYEGLPFTSYAHYGAFVAVILLPLLARFIFDRGKYDRVIWTILLVFFSIAICFSFSRGVWVSLIAAVAFMLLQRSSGVQHKRILIVGGAVVFFGLLLALPAVSGVLISRIKTITSLGYGSNKMRLLRWATAIMMFLRHPIIGCGYGSFGLTFTSDPRLQGAYVSQFALGAHNKYLEVLAETGLMGFVAWMWIIISFFRHGFHLLSQGQSPAPLLNSKTDNQNPGEKSSDQDSAKNIPFYRSLIIGVMAAELSLLVHFLVNSMMQADIIGVPFWLLMGLLPAMGNLMKISEG